MQAGTHACIHTHTHSHMHTHTHTNMYTHTDMNAHTQTQKRRTHKKKKTHANKWITFIRFLHVRSLAAAKSSVQHVFSPLSAVELIQDGDQILYFFTFQASNKCCCHLSFCNRLLHSTSRASPCNRCSCLRWKRTTE